MTKFTVVDRNKNASIPDGSSSNGSNFQINWETPVGGRFHIYIGGKFYSRHSVWKPIGSINLPKMNLPEGELPFEIRFKPWNSPKETIIKQTIIIDRTPPMGTISHIFNGDKMVAVGETISSSTPLKLNGRVTEGNVKVEIHDNGKIIASTMADSKGYWSFTTSPLNGDGNHIFTAKFTDKAGNSSSSTAYAIKLVTAANAISINTVIGTDFGPVSSGGTSKDATLLLSGTATPGTTITIFDGRQQLGQTTSDSEGKWSFTTPALQNGEHPNLFAVGTFRDGATLTSMSVGVTVDVIPNAISIDSSIGTDEGIISSGSTTKDTTLVLSGTASPGAKITVFDGNQQLGHTTSDLNGKWKFTTPSLKDGNHNELYAVGTFNDGNTLTSTSVSVNVNTIPDMISINTSLGTDHGFISSGSTTKDNTLVLSGTATPAAKITVFDGNQVLGQTTTGSNGHWKFTTPSLKDGPHNELYAVGTFSDGKSLTTKSVSVIVDATPNSVSINKFFGTDHGNIDSGSVSKDNTLVLSGTGKPHATITVFDGNQKVGVTVVDLNGAWQITTPALAEGNHPNIYVSARFSDGSSLTSQSISVTVDSSTWVNISTINSDHGVLEAGGETTDDTLLLTGQAEAESRVMIIDTYTGSSYGSTQADGNGNWTLKTSPLMPDLSKGGWIRLVAEAKDPMGNTKRTDIVPLKIASFDTSNDILTDDGRIPNGGRTKDNTVTLTGTGKVGLEIQVKCGLLMWTGLVDSSGKWSITTTPLSDGKHDFYFSTVNGGYPVFGYKSLSVNVDTTTSGRITSVREDKGPLADGETSQDNTLLVSGSGESGAIVVLKDDTSILGSSTVDRQGNWSIPTGPLENGQHKFQAIFTDDLGNIGSSNIFVVNTIQLGTPTIDPFIGTEHGQVKVGGTAHDDTVQISGGGPEGAIVSIYDGTTLLGTATVGSSLIWSYDTKALSEGKHSVYATISNKGKIETTNSIGFNIDTTSIKKPDHPWDNQSGWGKIDALKSYSQLLKTDLAQNDTNTSGYSKGLLFANINDLNNMGITGKGVKIAILDSGIDLNNAEFSGRISKDSKNYVNPGSSVQDDHGHGTSVASFIGAANDGKGLTGGAYDAELMICKIADSSGQATLLNLVSAIYDAAKNGAHIINISYGSEHASTAAKNVIDTALSFAISKGCLVFSSAGNSSGATPATPAEYAMRHSGGAFAVGSYEGQELSSFSNKAGSGVPYGFVNAYGGLDLAYGLDSKISFVSGTSFSAPIAATEAALLLSSGLGLSQIQVANAIVNGTSSLTPESLAKSSHLLPQNLIQNSAFNSNQFSSDPAKVKSFNDYGQCIVNLETAPTVNNFGLDNLALYERFSNQAVI